MFYKNVSSHPPAIRTRLQPQTSAAAKPEGVLEVRLAQNTHRGPPTSGPLRIDSIASRRKHGLRGVLTPGTDSRSSRPPHPGISRLRESSSSTAAAPHTPHLTPHPWGPPRTARHRALANEHDDCDSPVTYPAPGHNTGCIPYARGHGQRWPHQLEQRHRHIDMLLLQYHATYDKTGRWDVPVQKSPRWGCQTRNKRGARGTCRCCAALGSWGALCPGNHAEEPCTHLQPMNWPHRLEPCARATPQTKVVPAIPAQKSRSGSARRRRCPGSAPQPTHGSG